MSDKRRRTVTLKHSNRYSQEFATCMGPSLNACFNLDYLKKHHVPAREAYALVEFRAQVRYQCSASVAKGAL